METSQQMSETQRAEAFREFLAAQLTKQTKSLDTIRSLMILWFVLTLVGELFLFIAARTG